jgi:hypothetical protein
VLRGIEQQPKLIEIELQLFSLCFFVKRSSLAFKAFFEKKEIENVNKSEIDATSSRVEKNSDRHPELQSDHAIYFAD